MIVGYSTRSVAYLQQTTVQFKVYDGPDVHATVMFSPAPVRLVAAESTVQCCRGDWLASGWKRSPDLRPYKQL